MEYEISTCQMQYDVNNKEMVKKDPCFIYSGGNGGQPTEKWVLTMIIFVEHIRKLTIEFLSLVGLH